MIRLCDKEKLSLKVKRCLINQVLEKCSRLEKVTCQKPKSNTKSNVNR